MKHQKKIALLVCLHSLYLCARFEDVPRPDADRVVTVSDAAPIGDKAPRAPKKKTNKRGSKSKDDIVEKKNEFVIDIPAEKAYEIPADAVLIDTIDAVVYAPEGTQIITHSEVDRQGLDGKFRTLDDLVYEKLMLLDAQRFKMLPDEEVIDKHLAAVQRENNLTLEELKNIFKSAGYSYEEGREQFGNISIINQILDFKIRSRLIVPEKEVIAYYNANPEIEDASYKIQVGHILFNPSQSHREQKRVVKECIMQKRDIPNVEWQDAFWIEKNEIAQDKLFLIDLAVGDIELEHTEEGFQLFKKLEEKPEHTRTLEERYRSIMDLLRRPKFEQLFNEYRKQLKENSSVMYLNYECVYPKTALVEDEEQTEELT